MYTPVSCIYIMYWSISNPYIGQTVDFRKRKRVHLSSIRNESHYNYKVLQEHTKYAKLPSIEILESASPECLNHLEEVYIEAFDSIRSGLNIISGGQSVGAGVHNPASVHAREALISCFLLLKDPFLSLVEISTLSGVPHTSVKKISQGAQHSWLHLEFPDVLFEVQKASYIRNSYSRSAVKLGKQYRRIQNPSGEVFSVENTLQFSKEHGLPNGNLCSVLLGKRNSVKGWIGVD